MTLLFEPDAVHYCPEILAALPYEGLVPRGGAIAQCTCGRFYVVDERTGRWRPIGRHSRLVREAMAHFEERHRGGRAEP